jgi:hypothetical protein
VCFCTYAEAEIGMDYRRWATSVYKKEQKICIGAGGEEQIFNRRRKR